MSKSPIASRIREMILLGELQPGERITETGLAERLGLSRTPIRNVLPSLAGEGLLRTVGRRGYAVAWFSDSESLEALELRALLEGQAARMVAHKGAPKRLLDQLAECLAEGDALFQDDDTQLVDPAAYGEMNDRFHTLIVEGAGSAMLASMIVRLNHIPFVAPASPVFQPGRTRQISRLLFVAHAQHHAIVDAIQARDGARAEALFREHSNAQRNNLTAQTAAA